MVIRNKFQASMKERKKLLQKHELCTKGKFVLRRKEEQEVGRKMIFA